MTPPTALVLFVAMLWALLTPAACLASSSTQLDVETQVGNRVSVSVPNAVVDPEGGWRFYLTKWPREFVSPPDPVMVITPSISPRPRAHWLFDKVYPEDRRLSVTGAPDEALYFGVWFKTRARQPSGAPDGVDVAMFEILKPQVNLKFIAPKGYPLADNEETQVPGGVVPGTGAHTLLGGDGKPTLVPVEIQQIEPPSLGGGYSFKWDQERYLLWTTPDRQENVKPESSYPANQNYTFYFEALKTSDSAGEAELSLDWISSANRMSGAALLKLTSPKILVTAHTPGTLTEPGKAVPIPARDGNNEILYAVVLPVNTDTDEAAPSQENPPPDNDNSTAGPEDDDLVKIRLELVPVDLRLGIVEVKLASGIRVFDWEGQEIQASDLKVKLNEPIGPLADLASTGSADIWVETKPAFGQGVSQAQDLQLQVTYDEKDITGVNETAASSTDQLRLAVLLLPFELRDIKKVADQNDDVVIEAIPPKASGESENAYIQRSLSNKQIAYIEAHGATNDTDPEMPHLVAKLPGGPQGLKVRWKLVVEYKRGNGYRASYVKDFTRPEDTVKIPASGEYTPEMNADEEWRIFETEDWQNEITENGFFGGTAKLYIWFPSQGAEPTEPFMTFRIGGKNPDPAKAKAFINGEAGSQFWYAYAIAKHETFGRVREDGQIRYYNQFYTDYKGGPIGDASVDMGWAAWAKSWPLYNLDRGRRKDGTRYQNGPGGYGLFQLTLGPKEPGATIPPGGEGFIKRKEIWNWQDNARGAIEELQGKVSKAQSLRNALQATYPGSGAIPSYGPLSGLDALTITFYNGMYGGELKPIAVNGYKKQQLTCWYPRGGGWAFLQNSNRYCEKVKAKLD